MPPDARILCVGNRFVAGDDFGCQVHDVLAARPLPPGVEVVDGGIAGLNLLGLFEGCRRVVICDAAEGLLPPGTCGLIPPERIEPAACGHGGGVGALLAVLPRVLDGPLPRVAVVGIAAPARPAVIRAAARYCLTLAVGAPPQGDRLKPAAGGRLGR